MIKDDQGGTRNPYKCMNVMKQDAMDNKIIERCKTCEKQISQQEKSQAHRSQNTHTPILYFKKKSRQFSEYTLTHVKPYDGQITLYLHMYQEQQRILCVVSEKYRKIA